MGLQWFEGWDLYDTTVALQSIVGGLWPASAGGTNIIVTTAQARTGTRSLRLLGNGSFYGQRSIIDPATEIFVGAAYRAENYSGGTNPSVSTKGLGIFSATSDLRIVRVDNSGLHALYRGNTLVANFASNIAVNTWHYFCLYYNKSTGAVRCYVDRALQLSTTVATIGALTHVRLGAMGDSANTSNEEWVDDVFAWSDPTALELAELELTADFSVSYGLPDANGLTQQWTVTGAANAFDAINDVPPTAASKYIEGASVGDISDFNIPSLSPGVFAVFGVKHQYYGLKSTAGAGSIKGSIIANGTEGEGADNPQATAATYWEDYYPLNPNTGVRWIPADLASLDTQYERTA